MFPLSYSGDVREAKRNAVFPSFLCTLFLGKRFFFVGVVVVFFTLLSPLHSRNQCVFGCHGWNHIISTPTHGPPYPLLRSPKTRCRNGLLYIHTHTLNRETSTAHSCLVTRLRRAAAGTPITARLVRLSRTCKKKKKKKADRTALFLSLGLCATTCTWQDWLTPLTFLIRGAGRLGMGWHKPSKNNIIMLQTDTTQRSFPPHLLRPNFRVPIWQRYRFC